MAPEGLKAFFRFGIWITVLGIFLVFTVPGGSAEQVASICSLVVGILLLAGVVLVQRLFSR